MDYDQVFNSALHLLRLIQDLPVGVLKDIAYDFLNQYFVVNCDLCPWYTISVLYINIKGGYCIKIVYEK